MGGIKLRVILVAALVVLGTNSASAQRGQQDPQTLATQGAAALDERRFDDALTAFTAAAAQVPTDASLAFGAGLAAYMLGRVADAET